MTLLSRRTVLQCAGAAALAHSAGSTAAALPKSSAIGVNCFDLFSGPLVDEQGVRKAAERLAELSDLGIPFVRFAASPFWPKEWRQYPQARYYHLMESVFSSAEKYGVGLIPSLYWNAPGVSDLVGESVTAWALSDSRTLAFAARYAKDIVQRFGASKAILFWELGNEFNLNLDLNTVNHWWPKVNVEMGTPPARSPTDTLTTVQYQELIPRFASWIKAVQPGAQISSGSDIPRPNAFNLQKGSQAMDSQEQFRQAVCSANPIQGAIASIHLYPDSVKKYFGSNATATQILTEARTAATNCGQRLFLGEFGVKGAGTSANERLIFEEMLGAIDTAKIEMAALWVYDFGRWQPEWSVSSNNAKAWQLKLIGDFNANHRTSNKK